MSELYMIGNTHFDPVWEWTWDEAMASIRATFRSALDRMEEYPDFQYSFSSPPVFEWIKSTDPYMFSKIRQRVAEGRWELCEGWWNQPDCFSASGESYVRQGLYGQQYLLKNFGTRSKCAFNTDSFGHPDMLPQILKKSGIKYYCLCRPEERHHKLSSPLFGWRSRDGSEITAFRIGGAAGAGWAKDTESLLKGIDRSGEDLLVVYGVTDHGGAPTKRSIEVIEKCEYAHFDSVEGYFKRHLHPECTFEGEFLTGDFGVYCNASRVKRLNRQAEYALLNAERASVIAGEITVMRLAQCWQDVLFNQFHDILGGSSIKAAYPYARQLYGRAISTADEITHLSLQNVTANLKMPGENPTTEWNLVLWNLNGCEYNGYVEAEVQWVHEFDWYSGKIVLEDDDHVSYEAQIIAERSAIPGFRSRFIFKTRLPSLGCKCFKVVKTGEAFKREIKPDAFCIATDNYSYVISEKNGSITEVLDKNGERVFNDLLVPECFRDDGDVWCFNTDSYGEGLGYFSLVKCELIESGELIDRLKLKLKYGDSILYLTYTFYRGEKYFDLDYSVNWNEEHTVFKLVSRVSNKSAEVSTPYSHMLRGESKADRPMGEWIKCGKLLIITDSCFAYDLHDGKLGLTVLRSPIYGDLRIGELQSRDYEVMEQGITEGQLRVFPEGDRLYMQNEAVRFNNKPIVICESNHDGRRAPNEGILAVDSESIFVGAVKHSEDRQSVIVRLVDFSGEARFSKLIAFGREYSFMLEANEIKTLRITGESIAEEDLIESICDPRRK